MEHAKQRFKAINKQLKLPVILIVKALVFLVIHWLEINVGGG